MVSAPQKLNWVGFKIHDYYFIREIKTSQPGVTLTVTLKIRITALRSIHSAIKCFITQFTRDVPKKHM